MTEIKRERERGQQIRTLYQLTQRVLPTLAISNESIKYYASLVAYYSVFRLKRFDPWIARVYLLCFIHHRYQRHFDNLLASLLFYVRKWTDATRSAAKDRVYAHRIEVNQNLQKAAQVLNLFIDEHIAPDTPFHELQARAFRILEREKLEQVADHIMPQVGFDETAFQWEHLDRLGVQFKRYLRPILSAVDFQGAPAQKRLIEGIDFLKSAFAQGRSLGSYPAVQIPTGFLLPKTDGICMPTKQRDRADLFPTATSFTSTVSCGSGWKRATSTAATVSDSAVSRRI